MPIAIDRREFLAGLAPAAVASAAEDLPKPTPAELELLRTLWRLGPSSVKQVHEAQQAERPELGYANVLRLMQIMHGKGLLKRDESQRYFQRSIAITGIK